MPFYFHPPKQIYCTSKPANGYFVYEICHIPLGRSHNSGIELSVYRPQQALRSLFGQTPLKRKVSSISLVESPSIRAIVFAVFLQFLASASDVDQFVILYRPEDIRTKTLQPGGKVSRVLERTCVCSLRRS